MRKLLIGVAALLLIVSAIVAYFFWFHIRITDYPVPPRVDTPPQFEPQQSTVIATVGLPLAQVRDGLEREIPRTLASIDRRVVDCIPRETVRIAGRELFRTPKVGCTLVGRVTRGSITMSGKGQMLSASFPVSASIDIRDVGGIIERETATASAVLQMQARLGVAGDWQLRPDIRIGYRWTTEPGITVAGQRITFTRQTDAELVGILKRTERQLETQVRNVNIRSEIEKAWKSGFATLSLNGENPPVWLRLAPEGAGAGGVRVSGREISADVMLRADLQVFVGDEPAAPEATALGPNLGVPQAPGFDVTVPVLADYREVEPVILRALRRFSDDGITIEGVGKINARFDNVTVYATENGRIAVGIEGEVARSGAMSDWFEVRSRGTVWLTGTPVSEPDSEIARIEGLEVFGDMDRGMGDLLVRILERKDVRGLIEGELVEDFSRDYNDVVGKARRGIEAVTVGDLELSFDVEELEHDEISATGAGLFMPVSAKGSVTTRVER